MKFSSDKEWRTDTIIMNMIEVLEDLQLADANLNWSHVWQAVYRLNL